MKFMLIGPYNYLFYPLLPETLKELTDATGPCSEKHTIYDLKSAEDLVRIAESPVFSFVDVEISPLVEMDVVRKVQAKK